MESDDTFDDLTAHQAAVLGALIDLDGAATPEAVAAVTGLDLATVRLMLADLEARGDVVGADEVEQ